MPAADRPVPAGDSGVWPQQGGQDHPLAGFHLLGSLCRLCARHPCRVQRLHHCHRHLPVHHRDDPGTGQRPQQKERLRRPGLRWRRDGGGHPVGYHGPPDEADRIPRRGDAVRLAAQRDQPHRLKGDHLCRHRHRRDGRHHGRRDGHHLRPVRD